MENLYEYLIFQQMEKDLSFLTEEQIDEGKLKDHVKKAWQWLKGKFKRKKNRFCCYRISNKQKQK